MLYPLFFLRDNFWEKSLSCSWAYMVHVSDPRIMVSLSFYRSVLKHVNLSRTFIEGFPAEALGESLSDWGHIHQYYWNCHSICAEGVGYNSWVGALESEVFVFICLVDCSVSNTWNSAWRVSDIQGIIYEQMSETWCANMKIIICVIIPLITANTNRSFISTIDGRFRFISKLFTRFAPGIIKQLVIVGIKPGP